MTRPSSSMDILELFNGGQSPGDIDGLCKFNLKLYSPGLLAGGLENFLGYALPRLHLQIALIFLLTQTLHLFLNRIHLPRICSEILAGFILGKTVLGKYIDLSKLFPAEDVLLDILSKFGFIFFMFLAGVKMNPGMLKKAGIKGWCISLGSFFFLGCIATIAVRYTDTILPVYRRQATRSVVGILILTPFPVVAGMLIDLKIMNSELGRLSLASTLILHIQHIVGAVIVTSVKISTAGLKSNVVVTLHSLICVLFVLAVIVISRPIFLLIIKLTPEGKPVKRVYIAGICWAVLLVALIDVNVGLQYHFAPFVLGLTVPDGPPLGSTLADRLDTFISGLLAPLMMTYCAIKVDLFVIYDVEYLKLIWLIIFAAVGLKLSLVFGSALFIGMPIKDAFILGIILDAQGLVQGALYDNQFKTQTIDVETFAALMLSILLVAIVTHLLVRVLYDYSRTYTGYQKRNIYSIPSDAELRILACTQRQDDALAVIKLLEASNPSKECPIAVYALNLVELVGRATPLLIDHGLGQKNRSGNSRSQQLIKIFQNFGAQYFGSVNVQVFTSMSLRQFMHDDISSLAFDKLTSLIILPFHRKWSQQGKIIFESNLQRSINRQLLETSPCSVGILIDRRKIRNNLTGHPLYHVAVIFLGGEDDREALAYAKRMVISMGVHLTVVRLIASDDLSETHCDTVHDRESLRDIKIQGMHQNNITYREEKAKDGPQTIFIVHAMEDTFDLIMVGRRHSEDSPFISGLSEWCDLPELGPLGDILASSDIKKPVSVLVVQQQIVTKMNRGGNRDNVAN